MKRNRAQRSTARARPAVDFLECCPANVVKICILCSIDLSLDDCKVRFQKILDSLSRQIFAVWLCCPSKIYELGIIAAKKEGKE